MYDEKQIGDRASRMLNLTGKTAIITGSAQGLGRSTAALFAELGANVVIADLNAQAAAETAAEIESRGGIAFGAGVNIAEEASVKALFAAVDAKFGGVDVLVNNAAHRSKAEFFDMSVEQWDTMFAVTVRGTFLCAREALIRMKAHGNGGSIVNISSVGSIHTTLWGVNAHYDAAKAAVDSLTRTLSSEFAVHNVRVNSVLPGGMSSEGGKTISATYNIRGPMIGAGRIPLGRVAAPLEVAQAVVFLASSAASYITGQILAVDGGFTVS